MTARLLCVALLVLAAPHSYAQDTQSSLLARASDDASQGRYASSQADLEAAIALDAKQAEPWYQLGLLYGRMADYRGAEKAFRNALIFDPASAKAHCRLGQTLVAEPAVKEDWAGAVAEFRAALQLDPNYPEAESLLGLGLLHLGDRAAAIATLRHAIQLYPAQASAHLNLALALEDQPDGQEEAVSQYRAALAAKPDAPETESSLGKLLFRADRLPEAEAAFRHALKENPDLQDAHYGLAKVLKANKRIAEAEIELGLAAELEQRKPDATQATRLSNEALQLAGTGDLTTAIIDLRKAIQLKPDYAVAKYNLGLILADARDFAGAKQQLIDAASLLPAQARIWFDLGRVFGRLGEFRGASDTACWATRLSPADAKFALECEKLRAANPALEPAGRTLAQPRFGAASDTFVDRFAFAREQRRQGDLPGATGELIRALGLKPDAIDARTELAEIYAAQGFWERAIRQYRRILLVAGNEDASAHLALGAALLKGGHAKEAADQFDRVLELQPTSKAARMGLEEAHRTPVRP